ncbi:NADH-quinone oxidoreductase subunit NuoK [Motiliproteus sp. MSK22-1]|uniref:NADH-quinone oxidoreductase subunit NuoK n=1 Tax=Motiliproteus sp. MSK22-1 TaxID=1897630 RepID=UPI000976B312|nr:NADH-quinone oxidoreductase subunit NuoK [Motiliproteus sp. MSK22-1]OMH36133.1 NADH-quinone oxidoreductase subunit K [Motiliproteus sp. MSK22-1]
MSEELLNPGLVLAAMLFCLGLLGILVRRNLVFMLMSLEIMLNAAALAFVVAGSVWQEADGQVMFLLVLALAGSEVAVGLALVVQLQRRTKTVDIDTLNRMRG